MAKSTAADNDNVIPLADAPGFVRDKELNIYARLHAAMADLKAIEKDAEVEIKGRKAYDYISHDAVTAHVRPALLKHGVVVIPSITNRNDNGNRTELDVEVSFINIDSPEDRITINAVGYGNDPQDKGPGKAMSYALKIAYLKTFMLNSGDDIEEHDIDHDPGGYTKADVDAAGSQAKAALETWAHDFKDLIESAETEQRLKELQKLHKDALMSAPAATRDYFIEKIEDKKRTLSGAS